MTTSGTVLDVFAKNFGLAFSFIFSVVAILIFFCCWFLNIRGLRVKINDILYSKRLKVYIIKQIQKNGNYEVVDYMRIKKQVSTFTQGNRAYTVNMEKSINGMQKGLYRESPMLFYEQETAIPIGINNDRAEISSKMLQNELLSAKYRAVFSNKKDMMMFYLVFALIIGLVVVAVFGIYQIKK